MLILACLDASPMAPHILRAAARFARLAGGKVCLFRAIEGSGELPESNETLRGKARADLRELAGSLPRDLVAGQRVAFESSWRAICRAARLEHADVIVMGGHTHGTFQRVVGTTEARVVNHAPCDVLIVRAPRSPKKTNKKTPTRAADATVSGQR